MFTRLLRNDLMATLQDDFILAARAKGMTAAAHHDPRSVATLVVLIDHPRRSEPRPIDRRHGDRRTALRPAGRRVSVVVAAAGKKDYPLVQGGVLVIACAYVLINVLIDISYAILDPRIRRGRI